MKQAGNQEGVAALAAQNSVLSQIARPYASALFDLAQSENQLAQVETSLSDVSRLIGESADFSSFLRSPVISTDEKADALNVILSRTSTNGLVANFLRLIARNGRLFALDAIISEFREIAAKARGEMTADVTSATPLTAEQVAALSDTLKARVGKTVTLNQFVDPSLIGGLQVKVGSQLIDSSLKTKLTAMKIAMKEVG
ncbi:MAG TPA: F0F1 ATP synthase subunit delta [Devosia sp.]|nr:F0F1 ATP synthase subunit delta [Devosia sp.]